MTSGNYYRFFNLLFVISSCHLTYSFNMAEVFYPIIYCYCHLPDVMYVVTFTQSITTYFFGCLLMYDLSRKIFHPFSILVRWYNLQSEYHGILLVSTPSLTSSPSLKTLWPLQTPDEMSNTNQSFLSRSTCVYYIFEKKVTQKKKIVFRFFCHNHQNFTRQNQSLKTTSVN